MKDSDKEKILPDEVFAGAKMETWTKHAEIHKSLAKVENLLSLTIEETTALEEFFCYQYVNYDKPEQHEVLKKIMKFNKENYAKDKIGR